MIMIPRTMIARMISPSRNSIAKAPKMALSVFQNPNWAIRIISRMKNRIGSSPSVGRGTPERRSLGQ